MKFTTEIKSAIYRLKYWNTVTVINKFLGLLFIAFVINSSIAFAVTSFDPSFGTDGKVLSSPDGSQLSVGRDMALQADGKIVMVGDGASLGIIVARYNSNGSPDTTFGSGGWTSVTFGATGTGAASVEIQPDGKILVGGSIGNNSPTVYDLVVARLNSDGSLDTTFDGDGKATVSFNPEVIASAAEGLVSLKVAPDGKIVIGAALTFFPQIGKFGIARLNADGSLDTTFGTNGRVIDNLDYYKLLYDMVVFTDGSIAVGGGAGSSAGNSRVAQKYNANGVLQWTHAVNDGQNVYTGINSLAPLPNGKLIVVGSRADRAIVYRLNADGTVDSSFSIPSISDSSSLISVAVQPDGKIVANYKPFDHGSYSVVRFDSNGTLDSAFGSGGFFKVRLTAGDYARKILVQSDGKILVGGYTTFSNPDRRYFTMARYQASATVTNKTKFDYDGDGKSDVSVYRPSTGVWWYAASSQSGAHRAVQFGLSTDRIVPADYDGDGKTDTAIYRDGDWWILNSSNNSVRAVQFGLAEDKPQSGDFDGDGKDDLVVYRPSTGVWYVLRSSDNNFTATQWGLATDMPQSADYDGDGRTDLAVFRPSNGVWYIQRSLGGNLFVQFGANGDKPVAADYDGDGRTDFAIWRAPTRQWFILKSSNNQADIKDFGNSTDIPVPADYDGDGKADLAVFRSSNGTWYQSLSTQGTASQLFGIDGDRPTPTAFIP